MSMLPLPKNLQVIWTELIMIVHVAFHFQSFPENSSAYKVAWRKVLSDFWSNIEFSTWFTLIHSKFEGEYCSLSVTQAFISGISSVTGDSHTCNQITVLFYKTCNNSQIFFAVGLNSSKRMSHQIRRNSNSVSSSPTHPQAKVDILINKYV